MTNGGGMAAPSGPGAAEAAFHQGLKLLESRDAGECDGGVRLIEEASAAGFGPATERCALFAVMHGTWPEFERSLDLLQLAAEQGSAGAARQLILLARDEFVADSALEAADWKDLRGQIALVDKLRRPAGRTVSSRPLVRLIEGFCSAAECEWLIRAAEPRLGPALVYDSNSGAFGADPQRSNRSATFPLAQMDCVIELLRVRVAAAVGIPVACFEVPQVLRYLVGEEFKPHHDFLNPSSPVFTAELARNGQRVATVLIYLNSAFEGGETRFPAIGLDVSGKTGDALIFANVDPGGQPDPLSLHAGVPPTAGEKWVFSQWVREHPPRHD